MSGVFEEIGAALGFCESKEAKEARETLERLRAKKLTGHHLGCSCHWCKCASLGAKP